MIEVVTKPPVRGLNRGFVTVTGLNEKIFENLKYFLDVRAILCKDVLMSQIRKAILEQMLELDLNIHQVSKLVKSEVPRRTVYAFLTGDKDTGTKTASLLMKAVGLTVKTDAQKTSSIKEKQMEARPKTFRGRAILEWKKAGKPNWSLRELLGVCLLIDLEFDIEGENPAPTFRKHIRAKDYTQLSTWANGLKFASWK